MDHFDSESVSDQGLSCHISAEAGSPGVTGGEFTVRRPTLLFAAPRYQMIKKGVANSPAFGLEHQRFLARKR
jgi:hypothetical protein